MADRYTTVYGDQIDVTALGAGLVKDVDDNLEINVDDSTLEVATDVVQVKDLGITTVKLNDLAVTDGKIADDTISEAKLDIDNAPVDGYYLQYDDVNGLTWADVDAEGVQNDDIIKNEIPTGLINSINTVYTIVNTPVTGTESVYLNGIRQAPGSAKDYVISGTTITFSKAPRTGSEILVD